MGARYSDEQWKDLKTKVMVGLILAVIIGSGYSIGPGLDKFLDRARKRKTEEWAPRWFFNIGRIYESTWRKEKARAVYEEFYLTWCGDESKVEGLVTVAEETKYETEYPNFWPDVADRYTRENRPAWVGGEGAKPHPLIADMLIRVSRMYEDDRIYPQCRYAFLCVLRCFPPGTKTYEQAQQAEKRSVSRSF